MATLTPWRNRIVRSDDVDPEQLLANSLNWRIHPKHQQEALEGVLEGVGWVTRVIAIDGTDTVVDGHARVALAIRDGQPTVPVDYVDLDPEEERIVLATLDPIAALAVPDQTKLDDLLADVGATEDARIDALLGALRDGTMFGDAPVPIGARDLPHHDFQCPSCGYSWSGAPS